MCSWRKNKGKITLFTVDLGHSHSSLTTPYGNNLHVLKLHFYKMQIWENTRTIVLIDLSNNQQVFMLHPRESAKCLIEFRSIYHGPCSEHVIIVSAAFQRRNDMGVEMWKWDLKERIQLNREERTLQIQYKQIHKYVIVVIPRRLQWLEHLGQAGRSGKLNTLSLFQNHGSVLFNECICMCVCTHA